MTVFTGQFSIIMIRDHTKAGIIPQMPSAESMPLQIATMISMIDYEIKYHKSLMRSQTHENLRDQPKKVAFSWLFFVFKDNPIFFK